MKLESFDFPKLESPFVRCGEPYCVVPEIAKGCEWVFDDPSVLAVEKLDGTNVSVLTSELDVVSIANRSNSIRFLGSRKDIVEAVLMNAKGLVLDGSRQFGEVIGPRVQSNPYGLERHEWISFDYLRKKYKYKGWGEHPKDYETISGWFKELPSLFYMSRHHGERVFAEGIVFHHPDGRMAKLRRDMFPWFQKGERGETCRASNNA